MKCHCKDGRAYYEEIYQIGGTARKRKRVVFCEHEPAGKHRRKYETAKRIQAYSEERENECTNAQDTPPRS